MFFRKKCFYTTLFRQRKRQRKIFLNSVASSCFSICHFPFMTRVKQTPSKCVTMEKMKKYINPPVGGVKRLRRLRPGTKALREIRRYQASTGLLIPKSNIGRLVKEICMVIFESKIIRFQAGAILAIQEAAEAHLVRILEDANLACIHAKRRALMKQDMAVTVFYDFNIFLILLHCTEFFDVNIKVVVRRTRCINRFGLFRNRFFPLLKEMVIVKLKFRFVKSSFIKTFYHWIFDLVAWRWLQISQCVLLLTS